MTDDIREGTRETSCLICGRANAEQRVVQITTPGGMRLLLCDTCTARWQGYGLVVTVEAGPDAADVRAHVNGGTSGLASTAAAFQKSALNSEASG